MSRAVKILWRLTFAGILAFVLLIVLINYGVFGEMPSIIELQNPSSIMASDVYADDGTSMGKYYLEDRSPVEYKDISPNVIKGLVATEDVRFYEHSGIDGIALLRVVKGLGTQGGGSTITQQLALGLFGGTRATNPLSRGMQKLKEWIISVKLERNFTKEEIITYYLNTVAFSENVFGIRNAARTFFKKEPDVLTVEEAAVLVGMVNAPTKYNPNRNPKASMDRRNLVLERMEEAGFIPKAEAANLRLMPIRLNFKKLDQSQGIAPYFRENVLKDEVRKLLKDKTKPNGKSYDIYRDGLRIYTTINPKIQQYGEEAMAKNVAIQQPRQNGSNSYRGPALWKEYASKLEIYIKQTDRWKNQQEDSMSDADNRKTFDVKQKMKVFAWNASREKDTTLTPLDSIKYCRMLLQSGFMAMDPVTGEVKGWVGGIDYKTFKFDHVNVTAKRQVGSTIKPMLYTQAIEEAGMTPETMCENWPQYFEGEGWVPSGKRGGGGMEAMWHALAMSHNGVAAYLMKQIGRKRFVDFLNTCNVQTKLEPHSSYALGACDLSLYEMMWMYTMFAGRGFNTKPQFVTRIEDHNGNVILQVQPEHKEVISEITAYTMAKMMGGCTKFGTGKSMSSYFTGKMELGAKTGTTNQNSDDWFICYTPELMCGTWVGLDDRFFKTTSDGAHVAMPTCGYFLKSVYGDKKLGFDPEAKFIKPAIAENDVVYDYIEGNHGYSSPDAQGWDMGNGEANEYQDYGSEADSSAYIDPSPNQDYKGQDPKANAPGKQDTGKIKNNTPGDKPKAVMAPAIKPPKTEPKKDNDYRRK
ncbi:MAG: transglycosylase domain-containing protein [Chitinophagaceae bacterium]